MTKEAIIKGLKKVADSDKDKARLFADVIRDIIVDGLTEDGIVKIKGLGTFKVVEVKARKSVDVNTGAEIEIAAHKKVTFTAESKLADIVNEPFANMEVVNLKEEVAVAEKIEKEQTVEEGRSKDDEAIKKLGEDAESLKGILAMINGVPDKIKEEPAPAPAPEPEPEPAPEPVPEPEPEPEPVPAPEPAPERPVSSYIPYEPYKPAEQATHPDPISAYRPQPIDLGPEPSRKNVLWRVVAIVVASLLLIVGGVWLYSEIGDITETKDNQKTVVAKAPEKSETERQEEIERRKREAFAMDEEDTTYVYTGVRQPSQPERHPSYDYALAVIKVKEGDRLATLSKQYYGDKMFWVYIYEANKDNLRGPNELQVGMTLVIPRLDSKLIDIENEESVRKAMKMNDKIYGK